MKRNTLTALCLGLTLTFDAFASEVKQPVNQNVIIVNNDDRKAIKPEELPEAIQKALTADSFKGWAVKEAAIIKAEATVDNANADKVLPAAYYEVTLANEKETKVVKFSEDGTLLN